MKSSKPSLTSLKKQLRQKTEYELVEEIAYLYKTFPAVKEYYHASILEDGDAVLKKYKKIIRDEFLGNSQSELPKARVSVAKRAISDYKKVSCSNKGLAEIMLIYINSGLQYCIQYGYGEDPLYSSLVSMFGKLIQYIEKENLQDVFFEKLEKLMRNTQKHASWYYDDFAYMLDEYGIEMCNQFNVTK